MRRKAIAEEMVSFTLLICTLVVVVVGGVAWRSLAAQNASEVMYHYTLAMKDKEVQLIKDGFEKSAAFFSLMSTARELALHGGLGVDTLSGAVTAKYLAGVKPPLKFETLGGERIAYWIVPSDEVCTETKERVPHITLLHYDIPVGAIANETTGDAKSEILILWNSFDRYTTYLEEVVDGRYSLYVVFRFFFLKPGEIRIECSQGCTKLERVGSTPSVITSDGEYRYRVTNMTLPLNRMTVKITTKDDEGGNGRGVAKIEQVLLSIYDSEIDVAPNRVFTKYLNKYNDNMANILIISSEGKLSQTTISPLEGIIYRRGINDFTGMLWSQDGMVSNTEDYLGNEELLTLHSSGLTEEEAQIRYWRLYDHAERFLKTGAGVITYRLWEMVHDLDDTFFWGETLYEHGCHDVCKMFPSDPADNYAASEMNAKVDEVLAKIADEYEKYSSPDLTWSIRAPAELFDACPNTNPRKKPCDGPDECNGAYDTFEHYEYKKGYITSSGACSESYAVLMHCPKGSTCKKPECEEDHDVEDPRITECEMEYYHRYILKNLRILVTITDNKYKVFDEVTRSWVPLEFRFFVFMPFIEDDCCSDKTCSDYRTTDCSETPPPVVVPSL